VGTAALGCALGQRPSISGVRPRFRSYQTAQCRFLAVAFVVVISSAAQARIHRSQSWAETQYAKAEAQHQTLNGHASQARTRREYEAVIASYRRIVLEAPTSSKADGSAFAVAELTAEMGRHFKDDMALYSAIREYKYLRREYPGSRHRIEALLAIGEIYKNDLGDQADGAAALEELVRRYPHSDLVKEAQAELKADDGGRQNRAAKGKSRGNSASGKESIAAIPSQDETSETTAQASKTSGDRLAKVTDVQYWSGPDYTRVTVSLEKDVQFESQRIPDPERIFFDLKNANLASVLMGQSYDVDDGLVKKIRVAQYKPGRARIVVETAAHASYNASLVLNPPRIVIDIHSEEDEPAETRTSDVAADKSATKTGSATGSATAAKSSNDVITPIGDGSRASRTQAINARPNDGSTNSGDDDPAATNPSPANPAVTVTTVAGVKKVVVNPDDDDAPSEIRPATSSLKSSSRPAVRPSTRATATRAALAKAQRESQPMADGDRSLIRALGLRIGKIVIDPGHGGHDTGTIGPHGLLEKDLVLDVSKRLGKLLEARLGAEVTFTRRDDTFIPLETRTSIANQASADLFVSVHANSSHDPDARGVETYYLNFTSSPEALEVAARENAEADKSIHELQDLVKKIALKEKIEESKEFASDVQQSLHSGLAARTSGVRDRGVKKAPFVVLIGANMPSILAEISFISNPGDEKRLKSAEYRQRIAESLYRGIARYVNGLGGVKVASRVEKASAN
jgi:N-acetylmuramoyl-L-alanine amidase